MPTDQKVRKGFIKTENTILLMAITFAVGFVAGVIFSAYRSSTQLSAGTPGAAAPKPVLDSQQKATEAALINQTRQNPNDAEAWAHLGHFYFDTGNHQKAIEAYERSLDIDNTRPDVWTDLGVMYRRNGNPQKAVECFDQALAFNPVHEIALFNKGIVLMHDIQDPIGAVESWKLLIQINPNARTPNGLLVKEMVAELEKNK